MTMDGTMTKGGLVADKAELDPFKQAQAEFVAKLQAKVDK